MKKYISALLIILANLIITLQAFSNDNQKFIEHFSLCKNYIDNTDTKILIIYGFANRDCHYQEVNYNEVVKCAFSLSQLINITKEMKELNYNRLDGIQTLPYVKELEHEVCETRKNYGYMKEREKERDR